MNPSLSLEEVWSYKSWKTSLDDAVSLPDRNVAIVS